jgi:hypothetical protein
LGTDYGLCVHTWRFCLQLLESLLAFFVAHVRRVPHLSQGIVDM